MKYVVVILILLAAQVAFAVDISTDSSSSSQTGKTKDINIKRSKDLRDTSGKRISKGKSTGKDSNTSETVRAVGQAMQNASLDVSIPLANVFAAAIVEEETRPEPSPPFNTKILTSPRLPANFGINYEVRPGLVDSVKRSYLEKAAAGNGPVQPFANEPGLLEYRDALARYGGIMGQAYLYLANDIAEIQGTVKKDEKGEIKVTGIGYDDFVILAKGAFRRAVSEGVKNKALRENLGLALAPTAGCRFAGTVESILCGSTTLHLGPLPQLQIAGIRWYGPDGIGGFSGAYKLSSSWSYTSALEQLQTEGKFTKFAKDWQKYSDDQETIGHTKETILARKKALDLVKQNKTNLSPGRFIPNIH